jgi:peptidoglycan/LPS O-acetylase OafA/YrhL
MGHTCEVIGSDFLTFMVLLLITTGISWLTFFYIEFPGIRAGRWMVAWLVSRRSGPIISLEPNMLRTSE